MGVVKMTLGTGAFIDINVGDRPTASRMGTYPMIALKIKEKIMYLLEGIVQSVGSVIDWLLRIGLLKDYDELSELEGLLEEESSLIVIPALAGLGTPYWNPDAKGTIFGITRKTTKQELVLGFLEGIASRCAEVLDVLEEVSGVSIEEVIADGNVSRANVVL